MSMDMDREIREAQEAGVRALQSLNRARQHLESAKRWGLVDIFGGGMFTTMLKHSKIEEAQRCLEQAQWDLRSFGRELADVNLPDVTVDGFLSFADVFLDGFMADVMVQQRIGQMIREVDSAIRQVEDLLYRLRGM